MKPVRTVPFSSDFRRGPYSRAASRKPAPNNGAPMSNGDRTVVNDRCSVLTCTSLDEWHNPETDNYNALIVTRSVDPLRWQFVADRLLRENGDDPEGTIHEEVINLATPNVEQQIKAAAAAVSGSCGLPTELASLVSKDAEEMALATFAMLPQAPEIIIKLELFGSNVCGRWHRDKYVCRSLVAYNCSGTDYVHDSNVDFYELENCGNNDHIIRDKSQIHSIHVGDILMIKGTKFPGNARGLIHKSPKVAYYDSGGVQSRIVLKVDIV